MFFVLTQSASPTQGLNSLLIQIKLWVTRRQEIIHWLHLRNFTGLNFPEKRYRRKKTKQNKRDRNHNSRLQSGGLGSQRISLSVLSPWAPLRFRILFELPCSVYKEASLKQLLPGWECLLLLTTEPGAPDTSRCSQGPERLGAGLRPYIWNSHSS